MKDIQEGYEASQVHCY